MHIHENVKKREKHAYCGCYMFGVLHPSQLETKFTNKNIIESNIQQNTDIVAVL